MGRQLHIHVRHHQAAVLKQKQIDIDRAGKIKSDYITAEIAHNQ
jgi:hypothetical protein